jgi:site-specific recombinase XerD
MSAGSIQLATLVTSFFTRHLAAELNASGHTIRSYRDTFRLFLRHAAAATGRQVTQLTLDDLTPQAILSFLDYLEKERNNSAVTRNTRLAALRSFFSYATSQDAAAALLGQKILAIPFKRAPGRLLGYLTEEELRAILACPNRTDPKGRRDYLILALLYDTGARVQELLDLCPADFRLDRLPLVRITGKGRKQRIVPLLPATSQLVCNHLAETGRSPTETSPFLANYRGEKMTRSGVSFLLDHYCRLAAKAVHTLRRAGISPHTFRHTKAMHLLQAGVSPVTIKDLLGHAHLKTIEVYVQADLEMKRRALESTPSPVDSGPPVDRHEPDLLRWLEQLTP